MKLRKAAATADTKIELDAAKTKNKITLDGAKTQNRILLDNNRAANRIGLEGVKSHTKAEKDKTRATEREEKQRVNIQKKMAADIQRTASHRASGVSSAIGRAGRSTYGTVMGVAGTMGLAGGGMMIANALQENMALRTQAALLVNATRGKGGAATQDIGDLTAESQRMAGKYGVNAGDVMKSMNVVAARAGGAEGLTAYRKDMEDIIKTAKVFGVSMEDSGAVVAAALKAGVAPGNEMRQLFQDIAAMGKDGSIEVSDLASELAKLGGVGKMTELTKGTMLRRQVGMAQIAAEAAVSP
jgi:hypothetical protein